MTKEEKKQKRIQKGIEKPFLPLITIPVVIIIVVLLVLAGFYLEAGGAHDPSVPGHATGLVGAAFFMLSAPVGLVFIIISIVRVVKNLKRRKELSDKQKDEIIAESTDAFSQNQ